MKYPCQIIECVREKYGINKLFIVCLLCFHTAQGQALFYQDVFRGSVCVRGVSSWDSTYVQLNSYGSTQVRKAFLISGYQNDNLIADADYSKQVFINGNAFTLHNGTQITNRFDAEYLQSGGSVHVIDVTNAITSENFYVFSLSQTFPPGENQNQRFYGMSLVVMYEDLIKNPVCFSLWVNTHDIHYQISHQYGNLMPVDTTQDVGLSLSMGHILSNSNPIYDGSFVWVNNDSLGLIGGPDEFNVSTPGTIMGQFDYVQGILTGYGDDVENNTMNDADVLANIKYIVPNHNTQITTNLFYQRASASLIAKSSNPIWATFLAYTTPCDTFTATVTPDTITCAGQPLQLQATGGQAYAWLPQVGLSCYNCPNPVFQHDSTINYTVRIWNTDSCSKVLPMRVRVIPPVVSAAAVTNSECEQPTGSITLLPASGGTPPYSYSINNLPNGTNSNFTALEPGTYTLQINDSGGCTWNDTLTVDKNTLAQAAFTATPATGFTPLIVQFTNQSTGAAHATWTTNGHTAHTWNYQHVYDQEGSYPVTLVVWNTDSLCSDTASFTVVAQNEMAIVVPTLWNIGMLPQYSLHTTNVKHLRFRLYDDTGRLIIDHELHEPVGQTEVPMSYANLTRPATAAYVYRIEATGLQGEQKVFTGKVVVVR